MTSGTAERFEGLEGLCGLVRGMASGTTVGDPVSFSKDDGAGIIVDTAMTWTSEDKESWRCYTNNILNHVSSYNYVITGMLFLISVTGVMMRNFFRPDLVVVKQFCLGVFGLSPAVLPERPAFLLHSVTFLVLLPYLPAHFFAAPFVNLEANRRKEELRGIRHEA